MTVRHSPRTAELLQLRTAVLLLLLTGLLAAVIAPSAGAATERASYRTQALPAGTPVRAAQAAKAGSRTAAPKSVRIELRADRRFSLAALRWKSSQPLAGRMRALRTDGTYSAWVDLESDLAGDDGAAEGDGPEAAAARQRTAVVGKQGSTEPIWTGPARRLIVELQGKRPKGLRAAFVDVNGSVPRVKATAARARQTAGIHPRSDWDPNNECAPRSRAALGSVQGVTVHHTAGSNNYTQAQVPAVMLAICKYHRNSNGWNDVGYNVLVDRYGGAWEGRAGGLQNAVIGAHAQGFNSVSSGISMIGEYTNELPPPAQIATVARVAAWKLAVAGAPRTGTVELQSAGGSLSRYGAGKIAVLPRVFAHRDVGQTACPGNVGFTAMDAIRAATASANPDISGVTPGVVTPVEAPKPAPKPVRITISTKRRLDVGASAVVTGTALQGATPLKNEEVALQVGSGEQWLTVDKAKTNTAGKYRFARKFSRSWKVRVARPGGDGSSAAVEMVVVPKITLTVPKRLTLNKKTVLRGTIKPGRGPVSLTVERRTSTGKYVKGATIPVKLKGRTVTVSVTPHSRTLYRFQLVYGGSDLAAPAKSPLTFGRAVSPSGGGGASVN